MKTWGEEWESKPKANMVVSLLGGFTFFDFHRF